MVMTNDKWFNEMDGEQAFPSVVPCRERLGIFLNQRTTGTDVAPRRCRYRARVCRRRIRQGRRRAGVTERR